MSDAHVYGFLTFLLSCTIAGIVLLEGVNLWIVVGVFIVSGPLTTVILFGFCELMFWLGEL